MRPRQRERFAFFLQRLLDAEILERDARLIDGPEAVAPIIRDIAKPGDFVIFLGAGNITQWAYELPKELGGEPAS